MATNESKRAIGFIGMGLMGSRMATRLLEAGYPLTVFDRTKAKTQPLAERGAKVASSPRELAEHVVVIMVSVTNHAAVEQVMLGPDGVVGGLQSGSTVIDLSTISPQTSRHVAAEVSARVASMLDAPVSGSTPQAEQGALIIMVGGDRETYERNRSILETLGKEAFYMGGNGMGVTMKLVVNAMLGLGMQALAEAIALGEKAGLEKNRLLDVLGHMPVVAPAFKAKLENARREEYPAAFPLQHMDKDFGLIAALAEECVVPMPATAVASQISNDERARKSDDDFSAVIRLMEELAGVPT
jgi:3-hydroxyisobutyrate dehydrogenase-like beta-hydroxyacid dehydrogenase